MNASWPSHVCVMGGGRWARVYLDVLRGLLPPDIPLSAHAGRGFDAMLAWNEGRDGRIGVTREPPGPHSRGVAIVANAAADHPAAVRQALAAGLPVLVEKPLATGFSAASQLVAEAAGCNIVLAVSQVFLFAGYLENFAAQVRASGALKSLSIIWTDPAGESRHGEAKRFDPLLPIQADVLPHIVSIMAMLTSARPQLVAARRLRQGLAMEVSMTAEDVPCQVRMEREADARRRIVTVLTQDGSLRLDFTQEPGTICRNETVRDADPAWARGPRPLARMLSSFFSLALDGIPDDRLDPALPLHALALSDHATASS
jgi:predicted dehydrogenase